MKRAIQPSILLFAAMMTAALAMRAQEPASAPASRHEESQQEAKKPSGIVPPGVKLAPGMPPAGAPNPFEFPNAASKTLPNGLRVFVVSDHREPAIAARLVILTAGAIKDPEGMPGVAQMTANLLTQGTEKRSAKEIAEAIDFVGGSLSALAGKDATTVTLDVVRKDLNIGLDLMSDVVLHPAFRSEELDRQRQQLLSGLTLQYSDPHYLASVVFNRVVYGVSPYGWPEEGTPETVKKLQRGELAKFHDANYAPNQTLLAFAGDITPEEAFSAAEKYFGPWAKLEVAADVPPAPTPAKGQHIWLIDKPDAVQTQIRVGKLGIRRGDPDYVPVEVTNRIFGGGYNSRLNTEVRIKKGLTYGANSSFNPHRYAGSFSAGTFTRTAATVEATKLVVDLVAKMSSGDVTPKEMDFARDYLAGAYPIQSETAEQVADRVLTAAAFDLPADFNRTYPERIRGVAPAQIHAVAQKYFTTKDLDIVLAGNVSAFRDALKKEFPDAQYTEIPFDQVDVLTADLRKSKPASAEATPESFKQGKEILLAAAKAAGGDALGTVTSISMTEQGKFFTQQGDLPITVKWQVSYPDRSHGEVEVGGNNATQVCDGKSAWVRFGDTTRDATETLGEFERGIALFGGGWGMYQRALAGKVAAESTGEEEIEGKKLQGVQVQGGQFAGLKMYFDPETHLLMAARYQSAGPHGASDNEQRWSDYRAVEGRQFAHSIVIFRDGARLAETTVQDLTLNLKLDDALFAKPEAPASK
jgi:zinc protease